MKKKSTAPKKEKTMVNLNELFVKTVEKDMKKKSPKTNQKEIDSMANKLVGEIRNFSKDNKQQTNQKVVILFSGGADSVLLLEFATELGYDIHCVLIEYGQHHIEEIKVAQKYLDKHPSCTYQIITIGGIGLDSALTGSGGQGRFGNKEEISIWHVPGRNTLFAGIALSIAENLGYDKVWLGADFSDCLNKFIDCYQEYVVAMNKVYELGAVKKITFEAPLMGMTKEIILEMLEIRGINQNEIFSGYGHVKENS